MQTKYLLFDTEATGTNPDVNGIIQIGGIIGQGLLTRDTFETLETFNIKANAYQGGCEEASWQEPIDGNWKNPARVTKTPFDVHGISNEVINTYPDYAKSFYNVIDIFDKHIDKFNKEQKFVTIGYNIKFDDEMLEGWAKRIGFKYLRTYVSHAKIDVMDIARLAEAMGVLPSTPKNHKLETMCQLFNIPIEAHDALADITATKDLLFALQDCIKGAK